MRYALLLICLLFCTAPAYAQPAITGLWLTQHRDGVIQIFDCNNGLCGRIVGFFLDRPSDPSPRDYRGVSQCDLPLIIDARPIRPNLWKGHIIDPRNGKVYGVEMHVMPQGNLALRGFLGIPLLGQTQIWTRYHGYVPPDCRITPPPAVEAMSAEPSYRGD
jgi:uncharacterized protein (DUF2147 family)